jgi:Cys-rich protein (TIGR01571 family)
MKFEVEAPIDLKCGYPLEVDINGVTVLLTVAYDVKAGEIIPCTSLQVILIKSTACELICFVLPKVEYDSSRPSKDSEQSNKTNTDIAQSNLAPLGRWRYELCGCCNLCCISGLWWNAYCLPCIVWGQLLTRLKLGPFADPGASPGCLNKTFFIVVGYVSFLYLILILLWIIVAAKYDCHNGEDTYYDEYYEYSVEYRACYYTGNPLGIWIPAFVIATSYTVYAVVMLTRLRGHMRRQYKIPGSCFGDCCCIYWCTCCSAIQMARHTHDEHNYKYQCCNKTGLPPDAPQIV